MVADTDSLLIHKTRPAQFGSFLRTVPFLCVTGLMMLLLDIRRGIGLLKSTVPRQWQEMPVSAGARPTATGVADKQGGLKKILYYTDNNKRTNWYGLGQEPFAQCKVKGCFAVENDGTQDLSNFDAVLINPWAGQNGTDFAANNSSQKPLTSPKPRRAKFVFYSVESPQYHSASRWADDFFDWTWTYRFDGDMQRVSGHFPPINQVNSSPALSHDSLTFDMDEFKKKGLPLMSDEIKAYAKKPKKISWIVSNCKAVSGRNEYAAELSRYIPVDIMGRCGTISCDRTLGEGSSFSDNCSQAVEKDYKYYLSFENSLCLDYVTEKFFLAFQRNVIPIVMGGNDYTRFAPPHSFIDVNDFEDAEHLAEYIQKLEEDETLYLSYFWWRQHFDLPVRGNSRERSDLNGMCQLCEKLHNVDEEHPPQKPLNITHWWDEKGKCRLP